MKNYYRNLLCICILFASSALVAQEYGQELEFSIEVTPPKFIYVDEDMNVQQGNIYTYIRDNFQYPDMDSWYVSGTLVVRFTVTSEGGLEKFEVLNSVQDQVDEELMRVIETSEGMWKPGTNNGNSVDMQQEVIFTVKAAATKDQADDLDFNKIAAKNYVKGNVAFFNKDNPRRALNMYNEAIRYMPLDKSALMVRGLCYYELGKVEKAFADWERVRELGGSEIEGSLLSKYREKEGFEELSQLLLNE